MAFSAAKAMKATMAMKATKAMKAPKIMKTMHETVADLFCIWVRVRPMIMYKKCKRRNANETE